jgi:hypothetical protein
VPWSLLRPLNQENFLWGPGADRDSFVIDSSSFCAETERNVNRNKASAAAIDAVCSCYGNSLADVTTRTELAYIGQHHTFPPSTIEKTNAVSQKCAQLFRASSDAETPNSAWLSWLLCLLRLRVPRQSEILASLPYRGGHDHDSPNHFIVAFRFVAAPPWSSVDWPATSSERSAAAAQVRFGSSPRTDFSGWFTEFGRRS